MTKVVDVSVKERVGDIVREILEKRSVSKAVLADDELRAVGLTSMDMVSLMLAVEAAFDLTIPETDMTLDNFRTIAAVDTLVTTLLRDR